MKSNYLRLLSGHSLGISLLLNIFSTWRDWKHLTYIRWNAVGKDSHNLSVQSSDWKGNQQLEHYLEI